MSSSPPPSPSNLAPTPLLLDTPTTSTTPESIPRTRIPGRQRSRTFEEVEAEEKAKSIRAALVKGKGKGKEREPENEGVGEEGVEGDGEEEGEGEITEGELRAEVSLLFLGLFFVGVQDAASEKEGPLEWEVNCSRSCI